MIIRKHKKTPKATVYWEKTINRKTVHFNQCFDTYEEALAFTEIPREVKMIHCAYCGKEVQKKQFNQVTCGSKQCFKMRQRELYKKSTEGKTPDILSLTALEMLVDLIERRKLTDKEAAKVLNRKPEVVIAKLNELRANGLYIKLWNRVQIMRRLRA